MQEKTCRSFLGAWNFVSGALLTIAACLCLLGCPSAELVTSPAAVNFGTASVRESFAVFNGGGGPLDWTAHEVVWLGAAEGWVEYDIPWLSIDPLCVGGTSSGTTSRIFLNASRTGLDPGTYGSGGILVRSNGGNSVVPVVLTVSTSSSDPGGGEDGEVTVSPSDVVIRGLSAMATFTVSNQKLVSVQWRAEVVNDTPATDPDLPVQVAVSPLQGVTLAGKTTSLALTLTDPEQFDSTRPQYLVNIKEQGTGTLLGQVRVLVDVVGLPAVGVTETLLDFGETGYQLTFDVANVGDINSQLDFAVFSKDKASGTYSAYDVEGDPLILAINASEGTRGVRAEPEPDVSWIYGRQVSVTILREGIQKDLEYRDLYVGAVGGQDSQGRPTLDPRIEPVKVQTRVAAAATLEGATNRSRPPSVERFVYLIRDKRGVAVDASNELIRNQMEFYVREDQNPLDPHESSMFIEGPENLKCNIVLLLDFTGSMYYAGVDDPVNPLQPGEAIQQMVDAARQFVLDLPEHYSVALMEYHERRQSTRIIHGFDTNKQSLVRALDSFQVPAGEHGSSDLYDALMAACEAVVREDPSDVMEFDQADVRGVVFVTDGWDTSSTTKDTELMKYADDNRVRLFPLGYSGKISNPVNGALLLDLAAKTGGHSYYASEVADISKALDTQKSLSFATTDVDVAARSITLGIRNIGEAAFTARVTKDQSWISISPSTVLVPPARRALDGTVTETGVRPVVLTVAPGLADGEHEATLNVQTEAGDGVVTVKAVMSEGRLASLTALPRTLDPGRIWQELGGQVVLTYTSLFDDGKHTYSVQASFPDSLGGRGTAYFEKDSIYWPGHVEAGQVTLTTSGIQDGQAEVFVRADFMPRAITQFRFRLIAEVPDYAAPTLTAAQRASLQARLQAMIDNGGVKLAPGGLIEGWRMLPTEGHGVYSVVTEPDQYPRYGAFGNLLKVTFTGLEPGEGFRLGFRMDNTLYYRPASSTSPSLTKYFTYPGCHLSPGEALLVSSGSSIAPPARHASYYNWPFDPEAPGVWDRDADGWPDFDDADPDDDEVGDRDEDGNPDLDDPAPSDPSVF